MDEQLNPPSPTAPHSFEQLTQDQHDAIPAARRRLGRGLSSLLGGAMDGPALMDGAQAVDTASGEFTMIDEAAIARNPFQPRKDFYQTGLDEMVESIREHGVLQPLIVRRVEGGFQLVAGERRLIAARRAGLLQVPCRVVELDDRSVCEVAIVENVQRTDLGELEKAQAFQEYLDKFGGTIEELAKRLGKDRSTISNCVRLLELPDFVKIALSNGKITAGHARALLPLDSEAEQIALCQRIDSEALSVRRTEEEVRLKLEASDTIPFDSDDGKRGRKRRRASNHVLELQQQLRELLGAKVEIQLKGKDSGKMIIHFSSNDEFERIVGFLRKAS